ncbi:hypothetical protein ABK040_006049 [Willaertia magna]
MQKGIASTALNIATNNISPNVNDSSGITNNGVNGINNNLSDRIDRIDNRYQILYNENLLGKGSFGKVYKGIDLLTGEYVAIKVINIKALKDKTPDFARYLKTEINIMQQSISENVLKLYTSLETDKLLYLVLQKCENNMTQYIQNRYNKYRNDKNNEFFQIYNTHICHVKYHQHQSCICLMKKIPTFFSEDEIKYWMKEIINGLNYLHKEQFVIHRDLKPENFLLKFKFKNCKENNFYSFDHYKLVIADFGLSKQLEDENNLTITACGTKPYKSPQILLKQPYSYDVDIWSLGVFLFEMICGYSIFNSQVEIYNKKPKLMERITQKTRDIDFSFIKDHFDISNDLYQLLIGMLEYDSQKRLSLDQILNHPFMKDLPSYSSIITENIINESKYFLDLDDDISVLSDEDDNHLIQRSLNDNLLKKEEEEILEKSPNPLSVSLLESFENVTFDDLNRCVNEEYTLSIYETKNYLYKINKELNDKVIIMLTNEESSDDRTFYFDLIVGNKLFDRGYLSSSQVRDFTITEESKHVSIIIKVQTLGMDDFKNMLSRKPIHHKVEIYTTKN